MNGVFLDECKEMFREYTNFSMCSEKIRAVGLIGFAAIAGVAYVSSLTRWTDAGESFREHFDHGYSLLFPSLDDDILFDEEVMGFQAWETAFHIVSLLDRS